MQETLEDLYQRIGQSIADSIPGEWQSAWVDFRVEEDFMSLDSSYLAPDVNETSCLVDTPKDENVL